MFDTNSDKRNFYVIIRGSVFEYAPIFDFLKDQDTISEINFQEFCSKLE